MEVIHPSTTRVCDCNKYFSDIIIIIAIVLGLWAKCVSDRRLEREKKKKKKGSIKSYF